MKHPSLGGRVEVGRASGNRGWEDSTERERASLSLVSHRSLTCKGLAIKRNCSHFKSSHIIHTGHQLSFGDDKDKDKERQEKTFKKKVLQMAAIIAQITRKARERKRKKTYAPAKCM